jgi:hypothetical protein
LQREVSLVKDHPAVFSYYIADEPDGDAQVAPAKMMAVYRLIKGIDPTRPVSMVFTNTAAGANGRYWAANYSGCYDIAMVDPYPIGDCHEWDPQPVPPCGAAVDIVPVIDRLVALHRGPVIFAPQAIGGVGHTRPTRHKPRATILLSCMLQCCRAVR